MQHHESRKRVQLNITSWDINIGKDAEPNIWVRISNGSIETVRIIDVNEFNHWLQERMSRNSQINGRMNRNGQREEIIHSSAQEEPNKYHVEFTPDDTIAPDDIRKFREVIDISKSTASPDSGKRTQSDTPKSTSNNEPQSAEPLSPDTMICWIVEWWDKHHKRMVQKPTKISIAQYWFMCGYKYESVPKYEYDYYENGLIKASPDANIALDRYLWEKEGNRFHEESGRQPSAIELWNIMTLKYPNPTLKHIASLLPIIGIATYSPEPHFLAYLTRDRICSQQMEAEFIREALMTSVAALPTIAEDKRQEAIHNIAKQILDYGESCSKMALLIGQVTSNEHMDWQVK